MFCRFNVNVVGSNVAVGIYGYQRSGNILLGVLYGTGELLIENNKDVDFNKIIVFVNTNNDGGSESYEVTYEIYTNPLVKGESSLFRSIDFSTATDIPQNIFKTEGQVFRFLDSKKIPQVRSYYKRYDSVVHSESLIGIKKCVNFKDINSKTYLTFDGIRINSGETFKYVVKNLSNSNSSYFNTSLYCTVIDDDGSVTESVMIQNMQADGEATLTVPDGYTYISLYVCVDVVKAANCSGEAYIFTQDQLNLLDYSISKNNIYEYNVNFEEKDYNTAYTFSEAIAKIPDNVRKIGMSVTFLSATPNIWKTYKLMDSNIDNFTNITRWVEVNKQNFHVHYKGTKKSSLYLVDVSIKKGEKFLYIVTNNTYTGDTNGIYLKKFPKDTLIKDFYGNGIAEIVADEDISVLKISCAVNTSGNTESYEGDVYIVYGDSLWLKEYIDKQITSLPSIPTIDFNKPIIWMPNKVYMLEDTTLQIFKCSIGAIRNPENYDLKITRGDSPQGYNRNNYFEYSVNAENSDFSLTFGLHSELFEVMCVHDTHFIHVRKGISPNTNKNILVIGDSFTDQQYWVAEFRRLLTGIITPNYSDVAESTIISDNLSNITFIGTQNTDKTPNEGYSGKHYAFFASDGSKYGATNPFWNNLANDGNGGVDFTWYCNQHSYSKIDYAIILLGTNGYNNEDYVNTVWDTLLNHNPDIKVIIMGMAFANPWSTGTLGLAKGEFEYLPMSSRIHSVNSFFQEHCNLEKYKKNFLFVDYNTQMDIFNNYHYEEMDANQRNNVAKIRNSLNHNDNIHPGKFAYWQIADAARPAFHYWCLNSNS